MDTKIVQLVEAGDTEENSIQINDQVAPQSIPTDTLKKTQYDVEIWDNLAPNSVPAGNCKYVKKNSTLFQILTYHMFIPYLQQSQVQFQMLNRKNPK